jgi:hypothetical protein
MAIQNTDGRVFYKCFCCQTEEYNTLNGSICISKNTFQKQDASYVAYLNEHALNDPTLPCTRVITCQNSDCTKKENQDNEIVYIKYDQLNLKYIYRCRHCKHIWTTK